MGNIFDAISNNNNYVLFVPLSLPYLRIVRNICLYRYVRLKIYEIEDLFRSIAHWRFYKRNKPFTVITMDVQDSEMMIGHTANYSWSFIDS